MMTPEEDKIYGCSVVHWDFLSNRNDCINRRKPQISNKMRSAGLDRYNNDDDDDDDDDDDFFSGGPCPSCRLAVNKETGRLKWCMGGNDTWRFRVKLMLLIPAVLLPITIIFIALSRSQVIGKAPHHRTYLVHTTRRQDEKIEEILPPTSRGETERAGEEEEEDRSLIPGMKTSYVPAETLLPSRRLYRRKRDLDGGESVDGQVEEVDDPSSDKNLDNFLDDYYYSETGAEDQVKENLEIHSNDYREYDDDDDDDDECARKNEEVHSKLFNGKYDDIEERSQDESDEGELGGRRLISDTSLPISDDDDDDEQQQRLENEADTDFHTFWKGEGNARAIREAQAKIMTEYMDRSADPCEDFYQFACGNWAKHNPIPKDKAAYDTFEMIRESLDSVLKELLEDPIPRDSGPNTNDATVKAKYLFRSCMNYEILEQRMERPLIQLLDELGGWPVLRPDWDPEKFDWLLLVAQLRLYNNDILISEWVAPDIKNSDQYVIQERIQLQFDQTSLGLPTRDYFLQPSNTIYLKAYKNYLIKIATLLGASLQNATLDADELIEFETKLAKITSSPDERRNVSELYQRMSIGELRTLVPQINWHRYLTIVLARPTNLSEPVVVYALQYVQDLVNLLSKTRPRTIANYLLWRFVRHRVNNLDDRFQEAKQKFYYILFGREQAPSRWKNCVAQVNSNMGMAVGSMFVKKYFDEKSKNDTLSMTREIQKSFRELLNQTTWIDDETKELATEKVNAMLLRIGYPDFILQPELLNERYKDVVIRPDKYFENTLNILQHLTRVEQDRLGSPVNKTLWNTAPAVVNAYYSRSKNRIMFPAGILQPPFYHRYFPRSLNFGGIGVVIGHEITHGFDDKGRLFDKDGNLHRWWKDGAIYGFHERAQCLIDQYSRYTVSEVGMQIDGINTQGENIADNGGIKQAFRAYQRWLRANGDVDEALPGLNATGKQLFFLNFAQVWCGSMRPEATRNKLKTAVHSPGKFRVIGTLSNSEDFAEVFHCPLGAPMNPVDKCSVW
ncbi:neprilysin-4-like isoform X3 [Ceratina calcarata]|uniref:Neprilysin-4-like isoform X3 n=1 Tax=Ceratina calcarata TaxID=156304 RepID=A0AAJ7WB42_9HYME|nr:neprilysin-4-like isoform X3 [Ceratina calcarata]